LGGGEWFNVMIEINGEDTWQVVLKRAIGLYLEQACQAPAAHTADTPTRVVRAFAEYAAGYLENPADVLVRTFDDIDGYKGMLHIWRIPVMSMCSHHILPIIGEAHFAYIPNGRVVGLSKIPRLVDVLSRRLQVQELLTEEIADVFQRVVEPKGCAVDIKAVHCCMCVRGVGVRGTLTQTTCYRGCFQEGASRVEFQTAVEPQQVLL
jgi:GTP cyclohydrolase I